MTRILLSSANPSGKRTEEILSEIRSDLLVRMVGYGQDPRREMRAILDNNVRILGLLTEAIRLAEENSRVLDQG
ncbi:histidine kinase [Aerophototrophica crusticola]|uniref:Histidine kinase n=1 Tax=Aerophototrophica crusticola TaxID=1709002 RepID=A0A858R8U6_9PROT|nr:histidine kinase [Rhodospirillaceae bacterium B3]